MKKSWVAISLFALPSNDQQTYESITLWACRRILLGRLRRLLWCAWPLRVLVLCPCRLLVGWAVLWVLRWWRWHGKMFNRFYVVAYWSWFHSVILKFCNKCLQSAIDCQSQPIQHTSSRLCVNLESSIQDFWIKEAKLNSFELTLTQISRVGDIASCLKSYPKLTRRCIYRSTLCAKRSCVKWSKISQEKDMKTHTAIIIKAISTPNPATFSNVPLSLFSFCFVSSVSCPILPVINASQGAATPSQIKTVHRIESG